MITQIWIVLLVGRVKWEICFQPIRSSDSDTSSVWNFCENVGGFSEILLKVPCHSNYMDVDSGTVPRRYRNLDIRLNAMSAADYPSPAPCFAFKEALGMSLL